MASYYPNVYASQTGPLLLSGLDANFNFAVDIQSQSLYAAAGGSSDIITATFTPTVTALVSGLTLYVRASAANTTTTPTFSPNGLTAKTIVKNSNTALAVGDIAGAGHILILQYDATLGFWKLSNPAVSSSIPDEIVNAQTGTTYTYLIGDKGKLVTHTNVAAIAGTLPIASSFGSGWWMDVQNRGAGTLTITPTTSTIDGAATLVLTASQGVRIASDGTNYFTQRGVGSSTSAQFTSAAQTITSAGALTLAHGLSFTPYAFDVLLTCTTADAGYSIGNVVNVSTFPDSTNNRGVSIVPDATNLNIRFGTNAAAFNILNKTTGSGSAITNSSWTVTFRARA